MIDSRHVVLGAALGASVATWPVAHVADPTDLTAVPSVVVAWLVGRARVRPERSAANGSVVPS